MGAGGPIVLLTDFGLSDQYVGVLKGVIAAHAPHVQVIDLTHAVAPGDVEHAAFLLRDSYRWFPQGTVFVCVVDPGVGTKRRAVAMHHGGFSFVGPDNGVFHFIVRESPSVVRLAPPPDDIARSNTFHGRDLFAPAAARLARGESLAELGTEVTDAALLDMPEATRDGDVIHGRITHIDRFGNCLTDVPSLWVFGSGAGTSKERWVLTVGSLVIDGAALNFAAVPEGRLGYLAGSSGYVEIIANRASAETRLAREAFPGEEARGKPVTFMRIEE